jgi:hypothetical protein
MVLVGVLVRPGVFAQPEVVAALPRDGTRSARTTSVSIRSAVEIAPTLACSCSASSPMVMVRCSVNSRAAACGRSCAAAHGQRVQAPSFRGRQEFPCQVPPSRTPKSSAITENSVSCSMVFREAWSEMELSVSAVPGEPGVLQLS